MDLLRLQSANLLVSGSHPSRDFTYAGIQTYREVQYRQLTKQSGAATTTYTITRNDSYDIMQLLNIHSEATLTDPGGVGQRKWNFGTTAGTYYGLVTQYEEQQLPGPVVKSRQTYTWTVDLANRPYVSESLQTIDPGTGSQKQSKTKQVLDVYGNVTSMEIFGYGSLSTAAKTYTNTYLNTSAYTSRYIRNRIATSQEQGSGSSVWRGYYYDTTGVYGGPTGVRQHDTANYGTGYIYRGNLSATNGPEGTRIHYYDYLGTRIQTSDYYGHGVTYSTNSATNYAAPSTITPNGNSSLATSLGYSSFLGLQSVTGPNGATSTINYDSYARPQYTFSPHGAQTAWTYTNSPPTKTGTTNGHWEKTTFDGLGG